MLKCCFYKKAKKDILNNKVIAFPTETVYGLGVRFDSLEAFENLNKVKGRPEGKPYTLMLPSTKDMSKYAYITPRDQKVINAFMPGPVTVLLKVKEDVPSHVTAGKPTIGIRVPKEKDLNKILNYINYPMLVPSANKSGEPPLTEYKDVRRIFKNEIASIFPKNAGKMKPSTIIDLTGEEVKIIRQGDVTLIDIMKALED